MLFDLRSRGRRRTVQVIYVGLALLMGGGLVLFGVGTGGGGGGLLGALGSGGSGQSSGAVNGQVKSALAQTRRSPDSAAAWANLLQARYEAASSVGYDSSTSTYTTAGKQQLALATQAWERYAKLTAKPDVTVATEAARAYEALARYGDAAATWQVVTEANPVINTYACLAMNAYAAKQTRLAQLAQTEAVNRSPKAQRASVKAEIEQAKTTPSAAAQC